MERLGRFWLHWLLVVSYFFYGWWNPLYLLLIFYSTWLDYAVVARMEQSKHKGRWLAVSLINNLFLLGFFKYAGFVTANLNVLLAWCGLEYGLPKPDILLPVGISFFTFQSMSYTIDFYRGEIKREPSFVRFAAFVSLFPQLVAGPIERASSLLPQLSRRPEVAWSDVADGASLFVTGLFKKAALANFLALYVDPVYLAPDGCAAPQLALATVAFAWQIYFDFSGYTDMARGVARMMGLGLMVNFRHPYLATGLGDFWSRWHISLSQWFRDYVYVPLGGNRGGRARLYRNLLLTFVVSGLWHGAAWTFLVWGLLHGVGAVLMRGVERSPWYERIPAVFKRVGVFAFVCFTWVFFRAETLADAWTVLRGAGRFAWEDPRFPVLMLAWLALIWTYQWLSESSVKDWLRCAPVQIALVVGMLLYLCFAPGSAEQPFLYFQF